MSGAAAFLLDLDKALNECRHEDVRALIDELAPEAFDAQQAAQVLKALRRKRLFEELATASDVFSTGGHNEPLLRQLRAQALIDQGSIYQGLHLLRRLAPKVEDDPKVGPEVRGLIGRALKQQFVTDGERDALTDAIDAYEVDGRFAPSKNRWHGINVVACIMRAEKEGIAIRSNVDAKDLARRILDEIAGMNAPPVWDLATAQEAAIALGDKEETLRWLTAYVKHEQADAFELGSTLRQLKEIWQLGDTDIGGSVLPVLEYELVRRTGGTLGAMTARSDAAGFEAVYGDDAATPILWLDTLKDRCESIARVRSEATGKPMGTGFLAEGKWFDEVWGNPLVFVTNSHVVSEADPEAIDPDDAVVEFTRADGRPSVKLGETLFGSSKHDLDVSVFRIEPPPGAKPIKLTKYTPRASGQDDASRVYVAGHPNGRELEVTLYDNELREIENPFVRYRCPTEGGNSGSPVMNSTWKAFALHHRAIASKQLNEGVLFEPMKGAIRSQRGATP